MAGPGPILYVVCDDGAVLGAGGAVREHLSGSASPTERTMAWLRASGYVVDKVEQRLPFTGGRRGSLTTRDFCGFADVLAFTAAAPGVLAVQATSAMLPAHMAERVAKIRGEPRAAVWLAAGNRIWVVGWALRGPDGKRKTYAPTVVDIARGNGDNTAP